MGMPSSSAFAAFEPAFSPTTTQSVFLLTDPAALPPRRTMASLAESRENPSNEPVTTTVLPANVCGSPLAWACPTPTPAAFHASSTAPRQLPGSRAAVNHVTTDSAISDQYRRFGTIRPRWHVRWHPTYRTRWRWCVRWAVRACGSTATERAQVGMAGFVHFVEHLAGVFRRTNVHRLHAGRASTGYLDFLADHHGVIRHPVLRDFPRSCRCRLPCVCGQR